MALISTIITRSAPCKTVFSIVPRCFVHRWVQPTLKELYRRRERVGPEPPRPRSTWIWNYNAEVYAFGKRLNEDLNMDLLRTVFTHKSYVENEEKNRKELGISDAPLQMEYNAELEKKGDTLINDYVLRYLRFSYRRLPEEGIQCVQKYLTSEDILEHVSFNIGTKDLILCEEFPPPKSLLVSTLKAFIGAIAQERGQRQAELFVQDFILTQLIGRDINEMWEIVNPMKLLMDILKRDGLELPEVRLIRESGRNTLHAVYCVGLYSSRKLIGMAPGETLGFAEEMAARDALKRLFGTRHEILQLPFGKLGHAIDFSKNTKNPSLNEWSSKLLDNSQQKIKISSF